MTSGAPLRPNGHPDAVALHLDGRTLTYGELDERISARRVNGPPVPLVEGATDRPSRDPADLTGRPVVDALVELFAAAADGRRVRIADPSAPPGEPGSASANPGDPARQPTGARPRPVEPGSQLHRPAPVEPGSQLHRPAQVEPGTQLHRPAQVEPGTQLDRPAPVEPGTQLDRRVPVERGDDPGWLTVVTSGSSGHPRPVRRSMASWTSSFAPLTALIGLTAADRVLLTGPLHATLHLFAAVHTLAAGAELTDDRGRATLAHAVPAVLGDLLTDPAAVGLRTVVVAGSALPPSLVATAADRGVAVVEYYGAAELSFVAAARHAAAPDAAAGLAPFPAVEIEVRHGEIWVRSPYLSSGYPPGVTGPFMRDGDGFATVGDRGTRTADGLLVVHGRGSSAITVGGATVLAEDIEAALAPLVAAAASDSRRAPGAPMTTITTDGGPTPDAPTDRRATPDAPADRRATPAASRRRAAGEPVAVVGAPLARLGAVVVAVIAQDATGDAPVDGPALRTAARRALSGAALPRRWLLADRLPRTAGGKLARGLLQDAVRRHLDGQDAAPGDPALRPLP